MVNEKNIKLAYISVIVHGFIVGFSFLFTKIALTYSNPLNILAHRFTFAMLGLIFIWFRRKEKPKFNLRTIREVLPLAISDPLLYFLFQTLALELLASAEVGIFLAISPIITLILASIFLKEKTSRFQRLSVLLSVFGTILILYLNNRGKIVAIGSNYLGMIFILIAIFFSSNYNILGRKLSQKYTNIELITVMIIVSFIGFNMLALGRNILTGNIMDYILPLKNIRYIISVIYLGILASLVTSMLTNFSLGIIEASKVSVFANLGTVVSIFAGVIFLNESIYLYHIIGTILIIFGVLGANYKGKRERDEENKLR